MRVTGLPGEHIRFANSELLINGKPVVIKNEEGPISYPPLDEASARWATVDVHIPEGHYFVVGDNSGNSFDSRFWGTVASDKVLGRLCFRYWPPSRAGGVE